MKKLLLSLFAASALTTFAQYQLTNSGFEGTWTNLQPYTGGESTNVGTTPNGWCVANVAGYKAFLIGWVGKTEVGSAGSPHTGSKSCRLVNGVAAGNTIPGYVTLGTSWNTADTFGGNADGGAFGGASFTGLPDALEFWYQRTAVNNNQPASVVAYLWRGTTTQSSVPVSIGGNPTTVNMQNRDRNILGMATARGGSSTYSSDFRLVASLMTGTEHAVKLTEEKAEWTRAVYEFTYHDTEVAPTQINVIFASVDYFVDRGQHIKDNTLTVDDVQLLYYSELRSAIYDGVKLEFTNGKATVERLYDEALLQLVSNGRGASIETMYDEETALLTITVKGNDISVNPANQHVYTVQFAQPVTRTAELTDLKVGGETIADFDPAVTSYSYASYYEEGLVEAVAADDTAEMTFEYDEDTGVLTITVQCGELEQTYTVQFLVHQHSTELADLQINGATIDGFAPDRTEYTYDGLYVDGMVAATVIDKEDAIATINYNEETALLTIIVQGEGGEAIYTIQFTKPEVKNPYDLNEDGSVDVGDVTLLVSVVLGNDRLTHEGVARYDLNGDGSVDVGDVTSLVSVVLNS